MKQKRKVSMIGALVLIIGAVALITGCPQPNNNKGNAAINNGGNNTGNTGSNNGSNTGGNTGGGANIVYTGSPLDEVVAKQEGEENIYFYFSGGVWYQAGKYKNDDNWWKAIRGKYSGKILTSASDNTKLSCVIISNSLKMYSGEDATGPFLEYRIVTNVTDNIRNAEILNLE